MAKLDKYRYWLILFIIFMHERQHARTFVATGNKSARHYVLGSFKNTRVHRERRIMILHKL